MTATSTSNYGGILIVWDRLFGSFVEEDDRDPGYFAVPRGNEDGIALWMPVYRGVESR